MPVYASHEFPLLGDQATIDLVRSAVSEREPFSLIRIGDGEAVVLSIDDSAWLADVESLHQHWGSERVTLGDVQRVRRDLAEALRHADVVGVRPDVLDVPVPPDLLDRPLAEIADFVRSTFPLRREEIDLLGDSGARRLALLQRLLSSTDWPTGQSLCNAWIHWELLASGALTEMLQDVSHLAVVTSKPELGPLIRRRFDIDATIITVPEKYMHAPVPATHVPGRYREIRAELMGLPAGTVALVGAGIPGKAYCHWLKEAGCVALDIGSVLDAWVGVASRGRVLRSRFGVSRGDHVPAGMQLREIAATSHRIVTPRWKPQHLLTPTTRTSQDQP